MTKYRIKRRVNWNERVQFMAQYKERGQWLWRTLPIETSWYDTKEWGTAEQVEEVIEDHKRRIAERDRMLAVTDKVEYL